MKCTERHGEMTEYMQRVGEKSTDLSVEEHQRLSDAHKNTFWNRGAIWRMIASMDKKANIKGREQQISYARVRRASGD